MNECFSHDIFVEETYCECWKSQGSHLEAGDGSALFRPLSHPLSSQTAVYATKVCVRVGTAGGERRGALGSRWQQMNYRFAFGSAYSLAFKREAKWFNASERVATVSSLRFCCYAQWSRFICGHSVILCVTLTTSPVISDPVTRGRPVVTPALPLSPDSPHPPVHLFPIFPTEYRFTIATNSAIAAVLTLPPPDAFWQ